MIQTEEHTGFQGQLSPPMKTCLSQTGSFSMSAADSLGHISP